MRLYKFPKWLKRFYPNAIWDFFLNHPQNNIFLTFDDGPTPKITEWILNLLEEHNAKATFFCVGNNVKKYPKIYQKIILNGHAVGNHSMTHINGLKTSNTNYINNVQQANFNIQSNLFRPPYGKIKPKQYKTLTNLGYQTVFWSFIAYDFDSTLSSKRRLKNIKQNIKPGAILVFHDSKKAFPQLKNELPLILNYISSKNYQCKAIKQ
ncbi:MAG TPA: polysaccharide deacetylase family protein [Crocinitomix sp.]|nr:polysaccharide deacetylase family protein [Crocinitomix sp.]